MTDEEKQTRWQKARDNNRPCAKIAGGVLSELEIMEDELKKKIAELQREQYIISQAKRRAQWIWSRFEYPWDSYEIVHPTLIRTSSQLIDEARKK